MASQLYAALIAQLLLMLGGVSATDFLSAKSAFVSPKFAGADGDIHRRTGGCQRRAGSDRWATLEGADGRHPAKKSVSWRELEARFRLVEAVTANIEECNLDYDDPTPDETCSESCRPCRARGYVLCRFCRGTKLLIVGGKVVNRDAMCPICQGKGHEKCKKCVGTGFVANWAKMAKANV